MRRIRIPALLLVALAILGSLLPRNAWAAGCGVQDLGACVDAAQYTLWFGLAALGWSLDRTLMLLAYQLDTFRWWLVEVAFTSAYDVLTGIVDPLIVPMATIAVIIGGLALLVVPIFGRVEVVKIRHALTWVLLAPLLLTLSGPLIVQTEQLRSQVGSALFDGVSAIAPGAIFGASGSDMAAVTPLYPSNPCGSTLARQSGVSGPKMDDLAAALLWADAEDIHCPDRGGPDADVPDRFYVAVPDGPGYATGQNVGEMDNAADRTSAVDAMQRGAIRTFLGLLPAALAVLDALVQFVFALCLIALWISLPIGLLFVFFAQTASPVTGLFRRAVGVLQVSWSSAVVLGMLFACLLAAAELRNAAAYTGFAIGALILNAYILAVAVDTLKGCLRTLSDTVAVATGLNPLAAAAQAGSVAAGTAGIGLAAATGGAGAALAGAVAAKQTGSGRYAAGAALGRFAPIAQVGQVAAAMGDTSELVSGTVAGGRSRRGGVRALATVAAADGRRQDANGLTMRDHALERRLARSSVGSPTVLERVSSTGAAIRNGALTDAVLERGRQIGTAFHDRLGRVGDAWQQFNDEAETHQGGSPNPVRKVAAGVSALDRSLSHHGQTLHLDRQTRRVVFEPRGTAAPPPDALRAPRSQVRLPRLLTLGYHVRGHDDGSVSFWNPAPVPASRRTPDDPQQAALARRIALVEAGALIDDIAALRREQDRLQAEVAAAQDGQSGDRQEGRQP